MNAMRMTHANRSLSNPIFFRLEGGCRCPYKSGAGDSVQRNADGGDSRSPHAGPSCTCHALAKGERDAASEGRHMNYETGPLPSKTGYSTVTGSSARALSKGPAPGVRGLCAGPGLARRW